MNLEDPVAVALRVAGLLTGAEIPHALYGGLAVAAYGTPRETRDADLGVVSACAAQLAGLLERDGLRAVEAPLRDRDIRLLLPEDVVLFKLLSTRERDLEDAASILAELGERLDVAGISAEVDRLAEENPGHDVRQRWQRCRGGA